ncbi:MAG TPA: UbiA family prenyltransferase [Xanthobacteraceae bacterium]
MSRSASGLMNWSVALRLGRVSNLPTVWTNVCAGVVLSGATVTAQLTLLLMISLSLFYVGGMFLNDAFDERFDQREQPYRPIPSGQVTSAMVFAYGFGLLALGFIILLVIGYVMPGGFGWRAPAAGALLAAIIVVYDAWHKTNPIGPAIMALCRLLVYVVAGLAAVGALPERLLLAAIVSLCYLIGLTYVAKQESLRRIGNVWPLLFLAVPFAYGLPLAIASLAGLLLYVFLLAAVIGALIFLFRPAVPDVRHAIMLLIAGISLLDGLFMAGQGSPLLAAAAVGGFLLTLAFQRFIAGT